MIQTLLIGVAGLLLFIFGSLELNIIRAKRQYRPNSPPELHWLLGHWPDHKYSTGIKIYNQWVEEYGQLFVLRWFTSPIIFLSDIKGIKTILSNEEYFSKGFIYRPYKLWFGRGLTPTEGEEAKKTRKILAPAFSTVRLQAFVPLFNRATTYLFDNRWKNEKYIEPLSNGAFKVQMFDDVRLLAFDTVGTCSGLKINSLCDESPEALEAFKSIWDSILAQRLQSSMNPLIRFFSKHCTPGGRKFYQAIQLLQDLSVQAINRRKEEIANTDGEHEVKDFLYHLMEHCGFEEVRVRDLIINFLFAGSDIVGTMIVWTIMLLAKHPEIQEKLYEELKATCPNKDYVLDTELSKVPLLLACIKESLRLFPPVPMMSRRCEKPFTVPTSDGTEELKLEKGQEVMMNFWYAQKAGSWERPEEFDPTRFLGASGVVSNDTERITYEDKDKDKGAFCPFSLGRRNCLGQTFAMTQGCIVVARILLRYRITVDKSIEPSELSLVFKSAMQPTLPIWFTLHPREASGA